MAWNRLAAIAGLLFAQPALAADDPPAEPAPPAEAAPSITLLGTGLEVGNLDTSLKFYRDGLGLKALGTVPMGELEEIILGFGAAPGPLLLLIGPKDRTSDAPVETAGGQNKTVLSVSDLDAVRDRLAAAGYAPGDIKVHEPSGARIMWAIDPDGHRLEITQPASPAEADDAEGEGDDG